MSEKYKASDAVKIFRHPPKQKRTPDEQKVVRYFAKQFVGKTLQEVKQNWADSPDLPDIVEAYQLWHNEGVITGQSLANTEKKTTEKSAGKPSASANEVAPPARTSLGGLIQNLKDQSDKNIAETIARNDAHTAVADAKEHAGWAVKAMVAGVVLASGALAIRGCNATKGKLDGLERKINVKREILDELRGKPKDEQPEADRGR